MNTNKAHRTWMLWRLGPPKIGPQLLVAHVLAGLGNARLSAPGPHHQALWMVSHSPRPIAGGAMLAPSCPYSNDGIVIEA